MLVQIGHDAEDLNIEGPDGVIACPPTQVDALRKAVEAEDFLVLRTERTLLASVRPLLHLLLPTVPRLRTASSGA